MDDEERADRGLKDRFKEKWTRQPSAVLFKELRAEAQKYMRILTNATAADGIVRSKYDTHVNGMALLSKSEVGCLSVGRSVCLCSSTCLFSCPSVSLHLSVGLSVSLPICFSSSLVLCLPVCVPISLRACYVVV